MAAFPTKRNYHLDPNPAHPAPTELRVLHCLSFPPDAVLGISSFMTFSDEAQGGGGGCPVIFGLEGYCTLGTL